jgi:hypothetical protein
MIVDDLNIGRIAVLPAKTNAPLIVDPDGILAGPICTELAEALAPRCFGEPRVERKKPEFG